MTYSIQYSVQQRNCIERNEDFIVDFFEKPNIVNVTAIIGKNGAGKSTIMDYIRAKLPVGLETDFSSDMIIYSMKEQGGRMINYIAYPDNWELVITGLKDLFVRQPYSHISGGILVRIGGGILMLIDNCTYG